jgi:hypothetical protein
LAYRFQVAWAMADVRMSASASRDTVELLSLPSHANAG